MWKSVFLVPVFAFLCIIPTNVWSQQEYDKITTHFPLVVPNNNPLLIKIVANQPVSTDKINMLKEAIFSTGSYEHDGKLVFIGWEGVLLKASANHHLFFVPENIKITNSSNDISQITIILTTDKNELGYSGLTTFTRTGEMVTNARIVIFQVDHLTDEEFGAVVRHEFGHALGLGHSTLYGDIMYPEVDPTISQISECDEGALEALYDGQVSSSYQESVS
ncbi:MAG: matrixin family metalloprotease [Thaumarchaeota archaeon]|nr:matrixin family metalloprotease [Nitrososphaerota archaeon]MDE1868131.1 matrixin family metalloprotease [Nitrososphaerota archaeon]